jgi:hypothetical protein
MGIFGRRREQTPEQSFAAELVGDALQRDPALEPPRP